ncbi:MAG TPA: acetolactate synthase large subunit [Candidatus Eisenbacteria bacterium]|nr:acetolactate synthase large subunit [Candidatus Eisenbacteria bacterium]
MNAAESLVVTARAFGVDTCFANPGTSEMPLVAALDAVPGIRAVLGLFEGVCTGAADGFARMAGRPAMTLLHLGPGLANGLANLHNARRARSPVLNVVGEHATWHLGADSALECDIEALAAPMSAWVRTSRSAGAVAADCADALAAATAPPGNVATLIVPADLQSAAAGAPARVSKSTAPPPPDGLRAAAAVERLRRGASTALYVGGPACAAVPLSHAARIVAASGCRLFVETFPGRMERGAGTPSAERFPYFPEQVAHTLGRTTCVVVVGAPPPVALFGWPGARSRMLPEDVEVVCLATAEEDVVAALASVATGLGAPVDRGSLAPFELPPRPSGKLDGAALAAAVAATMPEHAILVDEGATASVFLYPALASAAPHSWLTLTGGAIGQGLPCATGAAIACPDRRVVAFQADGSGLYTMQALWTQARESLDVTTIVCANRAYRILQIELQRAGVSRTGRAARSLTELTGPDIDWVQLAAGMGVPGIRANDADGLVRALERAYAEPGPHLIEAVLA